MQELKFSYGDIVTLLALLTSLGSVWHFSRELKKPREDLKALAEENRRILEERERRIDRLERLVRVGLGGTLKALWMQEQDDNIDAAIQAIEKELME